jgi:hypothetical protein
MPAPQAVPAVPGVAAVPAVPGVLVVPALPLPEGFDAGLFVGALPPAPAAPPMIATLPLQAAQAVPAVPVPPRPPQPETIVMPRVSNGPLVPLQIDVTISRYQGEKKVSAMPYSLAVNANGDRAQLNMGAEVAVPSTMPPRDAGQASAGFRSFNYRPIGTNILCDARSAEDGRFEVSLQIDDGSVYANTAGQAADTSIVGEMPVFRSFKSRNTLLLRDGQTRQYTVATDRVSGETVKIEVALKVVK